MKSIVVIILYALINISYVLNQSLIGKIVKVSDGDTVTLLTNKNEQIKIRLDGIDAPEKSQDFGEKSRWYLAELIAGKKYRLKRKELTAMDGF